jgi:hypothetical protein
MPKIYIAYCAVLIILLALANYKGIIYSTYLYGEDSQAAKSANHFHK